MYVFSLQNLKSNSRSFGDSFETDIELKLIFYNQKIKKYVNKKVNSSKEPMFCRAFISKYIGTHGALIFVEYYIRILFLAFFLENCYRQTNFGSLKF